MRASGNGSHFVLSQNFSPSCTAAQSVILVCLQEAAEGAWKGSPQIKTERPMVRIRTRVLPEQPQCREPQGEPSNLRYFMALCVAPEQGHVSTQRRLTVEKQNWLPLMSASQPVMGPCCDQALRITKTRVGCFVVCSTLWWSSKGTGNHSMTWGFLPGLRRICCSGCWREKPQRLQWI